MAKKTSLKDIAQVVGVSSALVSYVLNNQKENRISKEVARRIRQVAKELNYQPNQAARSLKTNRTRTLGLIVADIANPFSAALARIVEDEASKQQYTVIFGSSDENPDKCRNLIATLLNRQVDGLLIAAPAGLEPQLLELQRQGTPLVLLDRYFPTIRASHVALANCQALQTAVQHLASAGYQRIGLVTLKTDLFHMNERTRGYQEGMAKAGLPVRKGWLRELGSASTPADVGRAICELTSGPYPVEALVFTTNTLTLAGLKEIKRMNRQIPDELAIVGFDEADAYELFYAPLTYIRQPVQEMGQLATRILLEMLAANDRITQVNLDATLVVQSSTQPVVPQIMGTL